MFINHKELSVDALNGVVEQHITSGCDQYLGHLKQDTEKVLKKLDEGELRLFFSESEEMVKIVNKEFWTELECVRH
ncbi:hypothetical protein A3715_17045 [Oleiphilus sp. HI0009]|nr:hypothetical protein A3715_17045 [Oleiphilus sp. HI0009]